MLRRFLARFRRDPARVERRDRVSILVPFLIISAGLGVLAWRSYELSIRMERGANMLAVQYAGYAAEITARRVDAAVRAELSSANDEWQQIERRYTTPDDAAVREWINNNEWIVTAIYVPDHDPASSVYVSELGSAKPTGPRLSREFFTSSGTVRYTYDPQRLLAGIHGAMRQQPLVRTGKFGIEQRADVTVVSSPQQIGLIRLPHAFAFVSPLAPPLQSYAIRALVRTEYVGSGWENQRAISLAVSLIALTLMAIGGFLAIRGLNQEAETMKLRGALIANVSHELRTPLAMIRLGAETLKRGAKLSEKERRDIEEQVLREVLHLSHLVENVLDVARMQNQTVPALAFTPVHPRDLVTTLISSYESWIRSKGFTISVDIEEGIESQMWDRDAVSRAVLNLIDNAIKYSGDDKRIDISVRQTSENVMIEVKDRGIGIDSRDLGRIFDPYYRAQFSDTQTRRGAGLGLTLVQQIAASHGGRVEVDSQPGAGSTFRLLLPRSVGEKASVVPRIIQSKPLPS
ncbi:MAG TPA: HAMP domain-containing sensor histidine kinase [Thermoanaerobaculia bacterium]|jgi:signal transduction histidine kinase|nr:HAMP domain-containing sensor histidine kinase [Thermoanaerobaculia bacterium]